MPPTRKERNMNTPKDVIGSPPMKGSQLGRRKKIGYTLSVRVQGSGRRARSGGSFHQSGEGQVRIRRGIQRCHLSSLQAKRPCPRHHRTIVQ